MTRRAHRSGRDTTRVNVHLLVSMGMGCRPSSSASQEHQPSNSRERLHGRRAPTIEGVRVLHAHLSAPTSADQALAGSRQKSWSWTQAWGVWAGGRTLASSSTVGEAISHRPWHPDCTLLLMQHALLAPSIGALFGAYVATEAWTHRWGFKVHYLYLYGYFELAQSPLGRAVRHTTLFRPRRRQ